MSERLFLRLPDDAIHGPEADIPAGSLRAWPVGLPLRRHVAHLLSCREAIPDGQEIVERVLPDGSARLIFHFGDPLSAVAVGASATPHVIRLRDRIEGVSITLRPGAAAALLGLPAGELAGDAVPLDTLWHGEGARLLERLAQAPDDAARIACLQSALHERLVREDGVVHEGAAHAVRLIAESGGRRPLREVADAVGVGERRLQQIFHAHVGLSPRACSRLARLQACLRALRTLDTPAWADVAVDSGFYDQPHLVNEFQALCGLTPTEFLSHAISGSSKTAA
jgi:methylphosphotriester-DNA--protein-cysteine methyltransferase